MRSKLLAIFLLCYGIGVGLLIWHMDRVLFSDRLAWAEAQARSQISALVYATQAQLRNLQVLSNNDNKIEGLPVTALGEVSLSPKGEWGFKVSHFTSTAEVAKWVPSYVTVLLKSFNQINVAAPQMLAFLDPQRAPKLFVLFPQKNKTNHFAIVETGFFQGLVDRQKGQISQVFLVNSAGQTLAHTVPEYVASDLSQDPLVSQIKETQATVGQGLFKDLGGQDIHGVYEQVGSTNVYVALSTSISSLYGGRQSVLLQLLLVAFGVGLIAAALFLLVYRDKQIVRVPLAAKSEEKKVAQSSTVDLAKIKTEAYTHAAASLAHELKGPLAAIVGHARLLESNEHVRLIEEEARGARDIIRKLLAFAQVEDGPKKQLSLKAIIEKALNNLENALRSSGVKVQSKLDGDVSVEANEASLVYAIEQILKNSIEAMDKTARKELSVLLLQSEAGKVVLKVKDSGEGMDAGAAEKALDPFFTTRSRDKHLGMGLPSAHGIIRDLGGHMSFISHPGEGTEFELIFPTVATQEKSSGPSARSAPPLETPGLETSTLTTVSTAEESGSEEPPEEFQLMELPSEPELLVNDEIEKLIDEDPASEPDLLPTELSERVIDDEATVAMMPPPPPEPAEDVFTTKIDKPKINLVKKQSVLEKTKIEIKKSEVKS